MALKIKVRVTTKASANRIIREQSDEFDYRIYVTTVPENGKANKMVLKLLAKELKRAKTSLNIVQGLTHRDKTIEIDEG